VTEITSKYCTGKYKWAEELVKQIASNSITKQNINKNYYMGYIFRK
jgi:hypothetical protein